MNSDRRNFVRASAMLTGASAVCGVFSKSLFATESSNGWAKVPGILANIQPMVFPSRDFSVLDYGADPKGKANSQPAITMAIKACANGGGGRVVVPPGKYACNGPIHLLSNVNLYLEKDALVLFGDDPADYLPNVLVRYTGIRCMNYSPFLYANGQKNIAITGFGTFDGMSSPVWAEWVKLQNPDYDLLADYGDRGIPIENRIFGAGHYLRPTMFEPYDCENVLVAGVTFVGSPFWTMHPTLCSNVTIQNVTVLPGLLNDDGCDPDSCTNVLIQNCVFNTNDDNISIKAGSGKDAAGLPPCSAVVVRDCSTKRTDWSAFTIGTNISGGVEDVFFENCTADNCIHAYFIKGNQNLGGYVRDVYYRNCKALHCHHLLTLYPCYFTSDQFAVNVPAIGPITMDGITCEEASVGGFLLEGTASKPMTGIVLENIGIGSSPVLDVMQYTQVKAENITLNGRQVRL